MNDDGDVIGGDDGICGDGSDDGDKNGGDGIVGDVGIGGDDDNNNSNNTQNNQ